MWLLREVLFLEKRKDSCVKETHKIIYCVCDLVYSQYKIGLKFSVKVAMFVSIVIPVYNEEKNLEPLTHRLVEAMRSYNHEIIFVNDGSQDGTLAILKNLQTQHQSIRIIDFLGNFGQHMAIMAGFEHVRGDVVVTLDADLQNPPEAIPLLLEKIEAGYDYVGSYRNNRQDSFFRTHISKFINRIRESITDIKMKDQGCMLRAYKRDVVDRIVATQERSTFIPALAYKLSHHRTEIEVMHAARFSGESKYTLYSLIRLNFDLVTGFSLVPLQIFTCLGLSASFLSGLLFLILFIRRIFMGSEAEGVFTLFAFVFFLLSLIIVGLGFIGEYLGRIFLSLSQRPRYVIREIIE
jgi:undecaprenyl-phosphate 4-deoxy-4-formamido-L-arabinose transferase